MNQCLQCGENITEYRPNKQYCSNACKQKAYRDGNAEKNKEMRQGSNLASSSPQMLTADVVSEIVLETMSEMITHFPNYDPASLELFIYCKIKLNLRGE